MILGENGVKPDMIKKNFYKLVSLCIVLSILLTLFTVFPYAQGSENSGGGVEIIYNRGYEDGWNYSNGMNLDSMHGLIVKLTYDKISASRYDYYMQISAPDDRGGYMAIPTVDSPTYGKLFFEFDLKANAGNNMGGAVMIAGNGTGTDRMLTHIVSMHNGQLYLFGESVGAVPTQFKTLAFTFDFGTGEDSAKKEFTVSAEYAGKTYSHVYEAKAGLGLSAVYFGAQENLYQSDRADDEYFVDNVKIYHGVEQRCELPVNKYGTAVNDKLQPNFTVVGAAGTGSSYISGQPDLKREPAGSENVTVHLNRYFSEGWNWENGTENNNLYQHSFSLDSDYAYQINKGDAGFLNYYFKFVQKDDARNAFMRYRPASKIPREGKTYIEFDIKCSAGATIKNFFEFIRPGGAPSPFYALSLENGNLYVFGKNMGQLGEEWCHVAIEMDFDHLSIDNPDTPENEATDPNSVKYTAYVGTKGYVELIKPVAGGTKEYKGLNQIRIGREGIALNADGSNINDWYGLDNMQIYTSSAGFANIANDNYGSMVLTTATKDFVVGSGISNPSVSEIVDMSLVMKVNANNALLFGEKIRLFTDKDGNYYGAPYKENGEVMVSLEKLLEYAKIPYEYGSDGLVCDIFAGETYKSIAVGRDSYQANGKVYKLSATPVLKTDGGDRQIYIALDDVEALLPGVYVTYDETGLIFVAPFDDFISRDQNEQLMQDVAERFLYETFDLEPETFYELAKKQTNNFNHPYLLADQERFDFLHSTYYSNPGDELFDQELIWYMDTQVAYADTYIEKYAILDEYGNYLGIKEGQWVYNSEGLASWDTTLESGNYPITTMPYPETNGYDPAGGRLNVLSDGETCLVAALEPCALAYQITKDEKYLEFAYYWTWSLCQWEHWGPGHFLNCANTSRPLSISYDWLYNDYVRVFGQGAVDYLAKRIYENGVYEGWLTLNGMPPEHTRPQGDASMYWNHIGNWNPNGTIGMLTASLAVMGYEEYVENSSFVVTESLYYYGDRGMTYISFDGGYRESAGYWSAVHFMHFINKILLDTCGTDFGLSDCPGLNTTDYFGCHVENSDYSRWNYHDDWVGTQPSYWYYLSADLYDNPEYAALRYLQIHSGHNEKAPSRYDVLFYDKSLIPEEDAELTLDYVMPSIGAVVSRSSWEKGALYAGIMGGVNNVAHGQYDSGNWIYDNKGIRWFCDLGADNYNLAGGGLSMGYYKYSTEGNNTIGITSLESMPFGQVANAGGVITSTVVNEYGTATVIDQAPVFGGVSNVTYARRGMLLTNDRKTLVIQDEINFASMQSIVWSAHYDKKNVPKVEISKDGRTVLMTSKPDANGETYTLRVSLLTGDRGFKFEDWDTNKYMLDKTPAPDYSPSLNGIKEDDRSNFRKLVITSSIDSVMLFKVAIVLEIIDPNNPIELGYKLGWEGQRNELQPMQTWIPGPDMRDYNSGAVENPANKRTTLTMSNVISSSSLLSEYIANGTYNGSASEDFFRLLTDVEYTLGKYGREDTDPQIVEAIAAHDAAKEKYLGYHTKATNNNNELTSIAGGLLRFKASP